MAIFKSNSAEILTEEKCFITEWWNNPADDGVSAARVRVEPGVTTAFHRLKGTTERYLILEGEGIVEVGDGPQGKVVKGDVVVIPAGARQRITCEGSSPLIFLAVCTPRFVPENYQDAEQDAVQRKKMPVLETERLVMRPFRLLDAPDVQRLAGDFAIADTTALIPHPYPEGAAEQWISMHEDEFSSGRGLVLAVSDRKSSRLMGCISITDIDNEAMKGELGYWIAKDFWGIGYCTEAAKAIVNYGFEQMNLNRIQAHHVARNPASGRVMQKIGMKQEGYFRQATVKWGKFEDEVLYAILREDWKNDR